MCPSQTRCTQAQERGRPEEGRLGFPDEAAHGQGGLHPKDLPVRSPAAVGAHHERLRQDTRPHEGATDAADAAQDGQHERGAATPDDVQGAFMLVWIG